MDWLEIFQKAGVILFILFVGAILLFWSLPPSSFLSRVTHRSVGKFVCFICLDQYWSLFAPNPVSKNFLIGFEIEFEDGTVKSFELPEYTLVNGYQRAQNAHFVKLHNQYLSQPESVPKEAICSYVLQEFHKNYTGNKRVKTVHLFKSFEAERGNILGIDWLRNKVYSLEVLDKKSMGA